MSLLKFNSKSHLTLGVELELQLLDSQNFDLTSRAEDFFKELGEHEKIQHEIFLSMIEVNTGICKDVHEVKTDLAATFKTIGKITNKLGIDCAATGTHPFSSYKNETIHDSTRYQELIDRNQWIARRICIFGLHVHLGMQSKEDCIKFMNMFQNFLPHLAALSTSSPFWHSQDTGLQSVRLTMFESSPTSGHHAPFVSWQEFEQEIYLLTKSVSIKSLKDLWWDMRPSLNYGTLEIRICDGTNTFHELLGIVALIHALAHWFEQHKNEDDVTKIWPRILTRKPTWMIREHKWRALRYGTEMEIINSDGSLVPFQSEMEDVLKRLDPLITKLGYDEYKNYIKQILEFGTSSQRQLNQYAKEKDIRSVAKFNTEEFRQSFIN